MKRDHASWGLALGAPPSQSSPSGWRQRSLPLHKMQLVSLVPLLLCAGISAGSLPERSMRSLHLHRSLNGGFCCYCQHSGDDKKAWTADFDSEVPVEDRVCQPVPAAAYPPPDGETWTDAKLQFAIAKLDCHQYCITIKPFAEHPGHEFYYNLMALFAKGCDEVKRCKGVEPQPEPRFAEVVETNPRNDEEIAGLAAKKAAAEGGAGPAPPAAPQPAGKVSEKPAGETPPTALETPEETLPEAPQPASRQSEGERAVEEGAIAPEEIQPQEPPMEPVEPMTPVEPEDSNFSIDADQGQPEAGSEEQPEAAAQPEDLDESEDIEEE
mmetsp:Transcript_19195/g.46298  ORF Transcript_19195/g.46298 Transcript_19195/m.46298 type:complete len:325 (-) Transcript_19195:1596-2570(-)